MPMIENGAAVHSQNSAFIVVDHISKSFGSFRALNDVNIDVQEGEFICFLGPSGCGKSTLLRIIAGLERQESGRILSLGQDLSHLPPARRQFGVLFQSYALFPNLSVRENIVYGLRNRRMAKAQRDARLAELLSLVDLEGSEEKYPAQLSGGQQQRVALARAIAPSPRLLLLDEPLSALDAKVRVHLRQQIRDLQTRLGLTTIMVTHDQEEALSMADRVVAMNHGTVEQIGTPTEVYHRPNSLFVAGFVGKMNLLKGASVPGNVQVGEISLPDRLESNPRAQGRVLVCMRPEQVRLLLPGRPAGERLEGRVTHLEFLGSCWRATVAVPALGDCQLAVDLSSRDIAETGLTVGMVADVLLPTEELLVFPADAAAKLDQSVMV